MRRTAIVAVVALSVLSVSVAVQAVSRNGRTPADTSSGSAVQQSAYELSRQEAAQLDRMLTRVRCTTIKCLNAELTRLTKFVNGFYKCIRWVPVTRYGEDPLGGNFGYVWRDGTSEFNTTALDITVDESQDSYLKFLTLRETPKCDKF